jgi:hypothetical protein
MVRLERSNLEGAVVRPPVYGAVASIVVLFVALYLRREGVIGDPIAVTFAALGAVGFAGCTTWAALRALRGPNPRR